MSSASINVDAEPDDDMIDYKTEAALTRSEDTDARSASGVSVEFGSNLMDISTDTLEQRQRELELEDEADKRRQGCLQEFLFFIKHSIRDILRRKCHFCLAFCSVFVVVLSTLVVNTVIEKGPIIFLSLNQVGSGEFDAYLEPSDWFIAGPKEYGLSDKFFNYTQFQYLWEDKFNIAPRFHYARVASIDVPEI